MRAWLRSRVARVPWLWKLLYVTRHYDELYGWLANQIPYQERDVVHDEIYGRKDFIRRAFSYLTFNDIKGDYAEFGCNGAMTFRMAYFASELLGYPTRLWGFDSFQGLPATVDPRDDHPRWVPGTMATSVAEFRSICATYGMPPDAYTVVPGYYNATLQDDVGESRPDIVSFAYIDCDLYTSTRDVLRFLSSRIRNGTILAFDDYFCFSDSQPSGERMAAEEMFGDNPAWQLVPYQAFGWHGMSFIVEARRD
jgi:hypothetical protein